MTGGGAAVVRQRGRSVAITGASSFLGKNLVGVLEEDPRIAAVVAIDIKPPPTRGKKTRYYDVDLTQPAAAERAAEILAAEGVDTLVHLAFLASPTHATAWAHELESVGTMHLFHAARRGGFYDAGTMLAQSVNSAAGDTYGPMLDWSRPDGITFSARRPGAGGMDLYRVRYRLAH